jgi:formylglycine-generating enzyme required for sulfatase activity
MGNGWRVERRGLEVEGARLELGEGVNLPLVRIPAGEFVMGSSADEPGHASDESPQHRVRLAEFWMGQTPITQAQWRVVARLVPPLGQRWQRPLSPKPACFQPEGEKSGSVGRFALLPGEANTDQRPVERVSWHEAMEFCRRLDSLLPVGSGLRFTLPSEAQWEYACRAGTTTPFYFGDFISPELGMFPANAWGLQDVHGNVWEWCLDCWQDSYDEAPFDGSAWMGSVPNETKGEDRADRLLRGGSWYVDPGGCRSAFRNHGRPGIANGNVGFRVVCLPQGPSLNS